MTKMNVSAMICGVLVAVSSVACKHKSMESQPESNAKTVNAAANPDEIKIIPASELAASPTPAKVDQPASPSKKKIDELGDWDLVDYAKPHGWSEPSVSAMTMGEWRSSTIVMKNADKTAKIVLVKPSGAAADPQVTVKVSTPKDQLAQFSKTGAAKLYSEKNLLAVVVDGDQAAAKELLEQLKENILE